MEQDITQEIRYFHRIQNDLITANPNGGFVVIKDETVLGVWQNRMDAIQEAVQAFGTISFLVKNINDDAEHFINYSRPITLCHGVSHTS